MISLYDTGWRQGTILDASLQMMGIRLADDDSLDTGSHEHGKWIVATQDCDLCAFDMIEREDLVELRPVFDHDPPPQGGIRSKRLLLIDRLYLEAQSRRTMISPAALTMLLRSDRGKRDERISSRADRKVALKTWLGYRYDRPAVPPEYLSLTRALATEVEKQGKVHTAAVRDVFVQIEPGDPPIFHLFAVIIDENEMETIFRWLAEVGLKIPATLGVGDIPEVATADHTPLSLIENSFALDLTRITFGGKAISGTPGRLSHPLPLSEIAASKA